MGAHTLTHLQLDDMASWMASNPSILGLTFIL